MSLRPISYKRHRFPPDIVSHAVWLYFRFPLSPRLVEEMLLERGILVSYETIRRWALKFGADCARRLKRKAPTRYDVWHLDDDGFSVGVEGKTADIRLKVLGRRDGIPQLLEIGYSRHSLITTLWNSRYDATITLRSSWLHAPTTARNMIFDDQ